MAQPKYLTGDKAGIEEFINKFDVSAQSQSPMDCALLTEWRQVFLFDCDGV